MAKQPSKKSTANKNTSPETTVTRIKASDSQPASAKKAPAKAKPAKTPTKDQKPKKPVTAEPLDGTGGRRNPFRAMGDYFKGAWYELRQVRWPDRKATWSMTGALLAFTAFFVVVILLLDMLFKYVFQLIIG